jgi:FkbM family methyltransferase
MQSRRDFLTGAGAGASLLAGGYLGWNALPRPVTRVYPSYAQAGEDIIVAFTFHHLHLGNPTYLDIGAGDPILDSNTYHFYQIGCRGVLVEPNVDLIPSLQKVRPRDTVLNVGIGPHNVAAADYYRMSMQSMNTFSKEEALHTEQASNKEIYIKEVVKMPLVNVNDVIAQNFEKSPNFVSIDVEGLDLDVLKSFNFEKYRPEVFCVEPLISSTTDVNPETAEFMASKGYAARGGSFINTIFVDRKVIEAAGQSKQEGPG